MNGIQKTTLYITGALMLMLCFNSCSSDNDGLNNGVSTEIDFREGLDNYLLTKKVHLFDYVGKSEPNSEGFQIHLNLANTPVESKNRHHDNMIMNESLYIRVRTDDKTGIYAQVIRDTNYVLVDAGDAFADQIDGDLSTRDVMYVTSVEELKQHLDSLGINLASYGIDLDYMLDQLGGVIIPLNLDNVGLN